MAPGAVDEQAGDHKHGDKPHAHRSQNGRFVNLERVDRFDDVRAPEKGGGRKQDEEGHPDAVGDEERRLVLF